MAQRFVSALIEKAFVGDDAFAGHSRGDQRRSALDVGDVSAGQKEGARPAFVVDNGVNFPCALPPERPMASSSAPFFSTARRPMRLHRGAADHCERRRIGGFDKIGEQTLHNKPKPVGPEAALCRP
jgi:hypothetical protein